MIRACRANGMDGDQILLGPPFVITDDELTRVVEALGDAIDEATKGDR